MEPVIMVAEGTTPGYRWRQYFVITDGRCVVVEMLPAMLCGWKFHSVTVQGEESWKGYSRDQIKDWKIANDVDPPHYTMAPDLGAFRDTLLAVAAAGALSAKE